LIIELIELGGVSIDDGLLLTDRDGDELFHQFIDRHRLDVESGHG